MDILFFALSAVALVDIVDTDLRPLAEFAEMLDVVVLAYLRPFANFAA